MEKRNTIQKQLVLEAVAQLHNHPTAEQVYAQVVKAHPTISKATVYRNLASLSEDGRLRHLPMPAGADRFDHRLDGHAHIECTVCGRLDDVAVPCLSSYLSRCTGEASPYYDLSVDWTCPACRARPGGDAESLSVDPLHKSSQP